MELPSKGEAEVAIIQMMLGSQEARTKALISLSPDVFYAVAEAKFIFQAIETLISRGLDVSIPTIKEELKALDKLGVVDFGKFRPDIIYTESKVNSLIKILYTNHEVRRRISVAQSIISNATSPDQESFVAKADELYWKTSTSSLLTDEGLISPGGMKEARIKVMRQRILTTPVMSGFPELDEHLVEGFAPQNVSVITGRPNMGKSLLKACLIKNLCSAGKGVINVALDQSVGTEFDRIEAAITGIPINELKQVRKWAPDDPRKRIIEEAEEMIDAQWNYHIIHKRGLTLRQVLMKVRNIVNKWPIDVIIFDVFDKLTDVNVADNKAQTVGVRLGEIAAACEEMNLHALLLVQISRKVENRKDKRPLLSDLKDSGSYEEVARLVLGLYRDSYYNPDNLMDIMEVGVLKQNDGPTGGKVEFEIHPAISQIVPVTGGARVFS